MERLSNENFKQRELENCNFVKTILMLIVIFYHSFLFWGGSGWFTNNPALSGPGLGLMASWLGNIHIYAFTLVSGYIYAYIKYEKKKYDKFIPFTLNKTKRLLVPYLFVAICWVIPFCVYYLNYSVKGIFFDTFLGNSPSQLWFLVMIFVVFIMFDVLAKFFEKYDFWGAVVCIALYVFSIVGTKYLPNVFMIFKACSFAPLFWLGLKLRQKWSIIIRKIPALVFLVADIGIFLILRYVLVGEGLIFTIISTAGTFVLRVLGGLTAFVCLQKLADFLSSWKNNKFFTALSKYSMPMFLFHQQIIYISISLLNGAIHPYLHGILNFVISSAVSFAISFILMKFAPTRFLIGEKKSKSE